ncbi:GNAT family N-acetyltransferase [Pleomorphomonas diazotrophica]|uniref:GNAT family N-acetyltransferase n=1 Tax=Pleomorphomonas diazotrophica TaxID=1166257 RepID=A0A1I4V8J6_9HYPH|nr:GNAT family N-acetyltransferase [Pleomorphomonas diazotrophica]PKR87360.1 GNAT family N-acetyltransferase [Pleomorphomonas diazotrophica]SFM97517.1 FR47-like protein [Pleomorphomonas diazotrophica]
MSPLDCPVWSALTSDHRALAEGGPLAIRYAPEVAPFAVLAERTPGAFAALSALIPPEGWVMLHTPDALALPEGFVVERQAPLTQMVLEGKMAEAAETGIVALGPADVPEMMDLATRTRPGPFFPRTIELGAYIGIRRDGRLAAMAGERMRFGRFVEISAVCVDPDHRGRGYAARLTTCLARRQQARGLMPFLHVIADNRPAIALYEKLGFAHRAGFFITVAKRG